MKYILIITSDCKYGDGVFHESDIKYLKNNKFLSIETFFLKKFPFVKKETVDSFLKKAKNSNLIIFPFHSSSICQFLNIYPDIFDIIRSKGNLVSVWSIDNHLFPGDDILVKDKVDFFFAGHPNYFDHLKKSNNCFVLPVAYYLTDIDGLIYDVSNPFVKKYDVSCIFRYFIDHSPFSEREQIAYMILKKINTDYRDLKVFFGSTKPGKSYINTIKSSDVVINISIYDDFNIKPIEVIALNSKLLSNINSSACEIVKKYKIDTSKSYFFERNMSDFDEKFKRAIDNKAEVNTHDSILKNNMLISRYIEIINKTLGSELSLKNVNGIKINNQLKDGIHFANEKYSLENLGIKTALYLLEKKMTKLAKKTLRDLM